MSEHSAEAIGEIVKTRLEKCTVLLGAETNLGAKVYLGRRKIDDTMIPCVTLIEGADNPERERRGDEYVIERPYVAFAYIPCDPDAPNAAAHAALRDMKRVLFAVDGKPDINFGGQVKRVDYRGSDIGPRADGASFVVAAIEFVAVYVEKMSAP